MYLPSLPSKSYKKYGYLRYGLSTGITAVAATKASLLLFFYGIRVRNIRITNICNLYSAIFYVCKYGYIDVSNKRISIASIEKYAGDDPDVTDKSIITSYITYNNLNKYRILSYSGTGIVTRDGVGINIGDIAMTDLSRKLIKELIGTVALSKSIDIGISVSDGLQISKRTTNKRLGIVCGISILGTTGIVKPFSTSSWIASIRQSISIIKHYNYKVIIISIGRRTESTAMKVLKDIPEVCFIECGDFIGHTLIASNKIDRIYFITMLGKLSKISSGILMTHYTKSKIDIKFLYVLVSRLTKSSYILNKIKNKNSVREIYEILKNDKNLLNSFIDILSRLTYIVLSEFTNYRHVISIYVIHYNGDILKKFH